MDAAMLEGHCKDSADTRVTSCLWSHTHSGTSACVTGAGWRGYLWGGGGVLTSKDGPSAADPWVSADARMCGAAEAMARPMARPAFDHMRGNACSQPGVSAQLDVFAAAAISNSCHAYDRTKAVGVLLTEEPATATRR